MEPRNILLPTDFSDAAQRGYPTAANLARRFGARLHLVHVSESPAYFYFQSGGFAGAGTRADFLESLEKHLTEEAKHAAFEGVELETKLVSNTSLVDGLQGYEKAQDIDFAVLASHGRTGLSYAFMGSSAEKIVRCLAAPTLTVRTKDSEPADFNPQRVLVPYDFSENAKSVIPTLRSFAQTYTPEVVFYFVVEPLYPFFSETGHVSYDFIRKTLEETPKFAELKFAELKEEELAGINATLEIAQGTPTAEILNRASESDLVVMSTHGWTGVRHFFMGSVAETVVRKAPCSVLTVRAPAES